jgi:hypothetical protein
MQPDEVAGAMADPIAQELLQSTIPARLAYLAGTARRARSRSHSTGTG